MLDYQILTSVVSVWVLIVMVLYLKVHQPMNLLFLLGPAEAYRGYWSLSQLPQRKCKLLRTDNHTVKRTEGEYWNKDNFRRSSAWTWKRDNSIHNKKQEILNKRQQNPHRRLSHSVLTIQSEAGFPDVLLRFPEKVSWLEMHFSIIVSQFLLNF